MFLGSLMGSLCLEKSVCVGESVLEAQIFVLQDALHFRWTITCSPAIRSRMMAILSAHRRLLAPCSSAQEDAMCLYLYALDVLNKEIHKYITVASATIASSFRKLEVPSIAKLPAVHAV